MAGTWYLQRGRGDPLGPFSSEQILEGLRKAQIPRDSLAREVSSTAWLPLSAVPEFVEFLPAVGEVDPERLAPVAGPAWASGSERHGSRTSSASRAPASGTTPTLPATPAQRGLAPPAGSGPIVPSARPARTAPLVAESTVIPVPHRTISALVAAVGIVWASVRVGSLASPPIGWSSLVSVFPLLATHAALDGAVSVVVYPALFVGVLRGRRVRAPFGRALVRGGAQLGIILHTLFGGLALFGVVRSPAWQTVVAKATVAATIIGGPVVLVACLVVVRGLHPDDGDAPGLAGDGTILTFLTLAIVLLVYAVFAALHLAGSPTAILGS